MSEEKDYAVFILSHGRAKDIKTVKTLCKFGYTGKWFVVIDDMDKQRKLYEKKFDKDHLIIFNKKEVAKETDTGDCSDELNVGVFARNFIIDEAKRRGYKYHVQLDDDFTGFTFRYVVGNKIASKRCGNIDALFNSVIDYLKQTNMQVLSFALSSDYLGGIKNKKYFKGLLPKTMGTFFIKTNGCPKFIMRMNDDVTTGALYNHKGVLYRTISMVQTETPATQSMGGGMTEVYRNSGTYRKAFYSVICLPSSAKISAMGITDFRLHHAIEWNTCTPKILSERYKK